MNISIHEATATVVDAPASGMPQAAAPPRAANPDHDRRRLDDLLRQRAERLARIAAD